VNQPQILGVVAAAGTLVFVIAMLRRGILREKYAVLWLVVSLSLLVMAIAPTILEHAARLLGIVVPSNLLFLLSGVVLLLVSVQLSYEVSRLESRVRRLAEEVAVLSERIGPGPAPARTDDADDTRTTDAD
jgi:hypothetical protein